MSVDGLRPVATLGLMKCKFMALRSVATLNLSKCQFSEIVMGGY